MRTLLMTLGLLSLVACGDDENTDATMDATVGDGPHMIDATDTCAIAEAREVDGCDTMLGTAMDCEGRRHEPVPLDQADWLDNDLGWETNPPHSGPHWAAWQSCWGEQTWQLPRGAWIHNLEHGGVVFLYNCPDGCDPELETMRTLLAERDDRLIIMTEDPFLTGDRFAAVSWTWVHRMDAVDKDELECFLDQHYDFGPESVLVAESNQECANFVPPG